MVEKDCPRCEGKGWNWGVPEGFNPFLAGAFSTARASRKVTCSDCGGGVEQRKNWHLDDGGSDGR